MQTKPTVISPLSLPKLETANLPLSLDDCHAVILSQAAMLDELHARIVVLEERCKLDSSNSSKPPSSDGPGSGNRAQRRASARKRGAQTGHIGHTRAMLDESEVDRLVDCKPEAVCECGGQVELTDKPPRVRHQTP